MNLFLFYIIKASSYLGAFYLVYFLFLSKDTMYRRNRIFIVSAMLFSLILPLIVFRTIKQIDIHLFGRTLNEIFVYSKNEDLGLSASGWNLPDGIQFIFSIYITGLLVTVLKLVFDLSELLLIILKDKKRGTHVIHFNGLNTAGFSALGHIFINSKLSPAEAEAVIKHEQNHINSYHFFDILLVEIIKCFQWFNPFVYMFDRSLRAVHEYQADEGCLSSGITLVSYQRLILNQVFGSKVFGIRNSFSNPTLIKKRMIMMTKKRTTGMANLKLLMVLPVIAAMLLFFSACGEKKSTSSTTSEIAPPPPPPPPPVAGTSDVKIVDESIKNKDGVPSQIFQIVEDMPKFPGGDKAMSDFIMKNITYPENAKKNNIQGRVIVKFCVTYEGIVSQVSVEQSINPELDNEAMRIIKKFPQWTPGKQGGKVVNVWMYLPVTFKLN